MHSFHCVAQFSRFQVGPHGIGSWAVCLTSPRPHILRDGALLETEEEEGKEVEEEEEDSSSQESDHVWQWLSGASMEYTNWWGEGPDEDTMGSLKGGCIQLLRKGATSPGNLDTYYWARAATNAKCTSNDGDNGVICEM